MSPNFSPPDTPSTFSTPSMGGAQDRALQDALKAERTMRDRAENTIRDYVKLLAELAYRFDGERLENARREDPRRQAAWTVKDWRRFFSSIRIKPSASGWGNKTDEKEIRELNEKVERLQLQLGKALKAAEEAALPAPVVTKKVAPQTGLIPKTKVASQTKVSSQELEPLPPKPSMKTTSSHQVRGKKKQKPQKRSPETIAKVKARIAALGEAAEAPEGMIGSMASMLANLQTTLKGEKFPKRPPAAWKQRLSGNGRKGRDLDLAYQRYWSALWLTGHWGVVSKMEVETMIGCNRSLPPKAKS